MRLLERVKNFWNSYKKNFENFFNGVGEFFARTEKHSLFLKAAGIAFNILLYLIPMFLVAVFIVNILFSSEEVYDYIRKIFLDFLPPTERNEKFLDAILNEVSKILKKSSVAGWIGIAALIWLSSTLFSSLRNGLNSIFEIETKKFFLYYRLKDIILIILLSLYVFLASYVFPTINVIVGFVVDHTPFIGDLAARIAITGVSLLISASLFALMYRYLPNKRMPASVTNLSAGITIVMIEISRNLFAWYVSTMNTYSKFYGAYAIIAAIAIWVFYLAVIILISAELSKFIYDKRREKTEEKAL